MSMKFSYHNRYQHAASCTYSYAILADLIATLQTFRETYAVGKMKFKHTYISWSHMGEYVGVFWGV